MILKVHDVWKKYPGKWALQGVSFDVPKGKVLGVLGENGAGKSTLFRIIANITRPTKGSVTINGTKAGQKTRGMTAFLPDVNPFYDWMRVMEQMEFLTAFYDGWDMKKTQDLLKYLDIDENANIGTLSRGQKAKLKLVFAFSWPAKLVVMDEPLGGIDPPSRRKIINTLFSEFRFGEQTILMSTHLVDEIEEFVEDVIFLKNGELVLSGVADELREAMNTSLSGVFGEIAG